MSSLLHTVSYTHKCNDDCRKIVITVCVPVNVIDTKCMWSSWHTHTLALTLKHIHRHGNSGSSKHTVIALIWLHLEAAKTKSRLIDRSHLLSQWVWWESATMSVTMWLFAFLCEFRSIFFPLHSLHFKWWRSTIHESCTLFFYSHMHTYELKELLQMFAWVVNGI